MVEEKAGQPNDQTKPSDKVAVPPKDERPIEGLGLDSRGKSLLDLLRSCQPALPGELSSILDEVVCTVSSTDLVDLALFLRDDPQLGFDFLRCLSVVDYEEFLQVVYHLWSMKHRFKLVLKTNTQEEDASVPSVTGIWPAADWFEREGHDLFGVDFEGHPNMKPLLLWEGFPGYPGRRSYKLPEYKEY